MIQVSNGGVDKNVSNSSGISMVDEDSGTRSRSERMHQLRAEHQRRHAQRNGQYPTDQTEEQYEKSMSRVSA